jgi:molybdopterin-synthase adenylyltransferase
MDDQRYQRQMLLPQIGKAGQKRLAESRVLVIGCGALGCTIADQLARAGVGFLRIVDRDIVEWSNLHRQGLFDEGDVEAGLPKAIAAGNRLKRVNSTIEIDPVIADVNSANIEELAASVQMILDGTDNADTRYLINDVSVKHEIPWIYGGCVGTDGRVMAIASPKTPCLRCIFPNPPSAGELPTCDTAGVLGSAVGVIASMQSTFAIRMLLGEVPGELLTIDVWQNRFKSIRMGDAKRADCTTCGARGFEFLERATPDSVSMCGRNAVQVRPSSSGAVNLDGIARRLEGIGQIQRSRYFLRCQISDAESLTLFSDGRAIIGGTSDFSRAKSIYARYVGS